MQTPHLSVTTHFFEIKIGHLWDLLGSNEENILYSLLQKLSKKGNIWCIWGLRCGNGEEREGK